MVKYKGRPIKVSTGEAVKEPWVLFRYKDKFLPEILGFYYELLENHFQVYEGLPEEIDELRSAVVKWQERNPEKVKLPD